MEVTLKKDTYTVPQKQEAQHVILGRICWASTFCSGGRSRRAWLTVLKNSGRLWASGVIPSCHPEEDLHPIMRHLYDIGGLPVTRIGINECLFFINHPVYGLLLQQTYKTKTDSLKFFNGLCFGRVDTSCPVPSSGIGTRARYGIGQGGLLVWCVSLIRLWLGVWAPDWSVCV